jgi:hypothetical protein
VSSDAPLGARGNLLTDEALPIVSAGEVRALKQSLALAEAGQALIVYLDGVGVRSGRLSANQIRDDMVLGTQLCVATQMASGLPALLLVGIGTPSSAIESDLGLYRSRSSSANLIRSYAAGGAFTVEQFADPAVGIADDAGLWVPVQRQVAAALRFRTALSITDRLAPFLAEPYFVHTSLPWTGRYEAVLTRTDHALGDQVMCAGHLWWIDEPLASASLVTNPLGGPASLRQRAAKLALVAEPLSAIVSPSTGETGLRLIDVVDDADFGSLATETIGPDVVGLRLQLEVLGTAAAGLHQNTTNAVAASRARRAVEVAIRLARGRRESSG